MKMHTMSELYLMLKLSVDFNANFFYTLSVANTKLDYAYFLAFALFIFGSKREYYNKEQ